MYSCNVSIYLSLKKVLYFGSTIQAATVRHSVYHETDEPNRTEGKWCRILCTHPMREEGSDESHNTQNTTAPCISTVMFMFGEREKIDKNTLFPSVCKNVEYTISYHRISGWWKNNINMDFNACMRKRSARRMIFVGLCVLSGRHEALEICT